MVRRSFMHRSFKKSGLIPLRDTVHVYVVSECGGCGVMLNGDTECFRCSINNRFS